MATASDEFSCGVDIGEINLAIAFVSPDGRVINYRGAITHAKATSTHPDISPHLTRYEIGVEPSTVVPPKRLPEHACLVQFLQSIVEFNHTKYSAIEMQLASNTAAMSRYDGIIYGWLIGRFPNMLTTLNGSTCRKRAVEGFFTKAGLDINGVVIPAVIKKNESKINSYKFVKTFHPESWEYFQLMQLKMDDVCDTLVYAAIAFTNANPNIGPRSKKKPPTPGFAMPEKTEEVLVKPVYTMEQVMALQDVREKLSVGRMTKTKKAKLARDQEEALRLLDSASYEIGDRIPD
jgi:hypothetical protein